MGRSATWRPDRLPDALAPSSVGVEANERLTSATGIVILVLLFFEGLTLPFIGYIRLDGSALSWHIRIGLALLPLLAVKLGSTIWRFARYYMGDPRYRKRGAPPPLLRLLGPLFVISTVVMFASGIALWLAGPDKPDSLLLGAIHRDIFVVWVAILALHLLGHFFPAMRDAAADMAERRRLDLNQRSRRLIISRQVLVVGALSLGLLIGLSVHALTPAWTHLLHVYGSR